jgi:hypothetical protein
MLFLACDFMVEPNSLQKIWFKPRHAILCEQKITCCTVFQIHLQPVRQQELLVKGPKHCDPGHGCFPGTFEGMKLNAPYA